jgi:hypothetical protein
MGINNFSFYLYLILQIADPSGRAVYCVGLRPLESRWQIEVRLS